jgi:hypothetical protein
VSCFFVWFELQLNDANKGYMASLQGWEGIQPLDQVAKGKPTEIKTNIELFWGCFGCSKASDSAFPFVSTFLFTRVSWHTFAVMLYMWSVLPPVCDTFMPPPPKLVSLGLFCDNRTQEWGAQ